MPKPPVELPPFSGPEAVDCDFCEMKNTLEERMIPDSMIIRDEEIACRLPYMVCTNCGAKFATISQADKAVAIAVEAYQCKHGLLTASNVRSRRNDLGWTQNDLANQSSVSIASVKRQESGVHVLTKNNNDALKRALDQADQVFAGNSSPLRTISSFTVEIPFSLESPICNDVSPAATDCEISWNTNRSFELEYPNSLSEESDDSTIALAG